MVLGGRIELPSLVCRTSAQPLYQPSMVGDPRIELGIRAYQTRLIPFQQSPYQIKGSVLPFKLSVISRRGSNPQLSHSCRALRGLNMVGDLRIELRLPASNAGWLPTPPSPLNLVPRVGLEPTKPRF